MTSKCYSLFIAILFLVLSDISAQIGGSRVYEFINLPSSARITALGESLLATYDGDVALADANPALLNPMMNGTISVNYNFLFADISHSYLSYGKHFKQGDFTAHASIKNINYGQFKLADIGGNLLGEFKASETAFTVGVGKKWEDKYGFGVNIKAVSSRYESYNSVGILADFAGIYIDSTRNIIATLVVNNVGAQISTFSDGQTEKVPTVVSFGISKKLQYIPLRFSVIFNNLQKWNLINDNPFDDDNTLFLGQEPMEESEFSQRIDNLFRHIVFNIEVNLGRKENFAIRLGYNYFKHKDLSVRNLRSFAGLSFGMGIKFKRFKIDYGNMIYHLAGGVNHLSISTNLQQFGKIL